MQIAMVSVQACPLIGSAGQSAHVAELCAGLSAAGHDVVVYTRRDDSTSPENVAGTAGYDVVRVPAGPARPLAEDELVAHLGDFAEHLAEQWRTRRPDVVHTHHWTSGLVSVISAHRLRIPVVHSYHGFGETDVEHRAEAEPLIAREAAWIVATSTAEAARLWQLGVRRTQVSVVPGGVDAALFRPKGPVDFHDGRMRVVVTGDLFPDSASAAVSAALSTVDNVQLLGCGEVARADRPAVLRSADVVLCAPPAEKYGTAALEAMACGVPVVATAVGALSDVVVPEVTGVLVQPHDVRRLARALKVLLEDETLRDQFGIAGRDRVLGRYSRRRLAREVVAVYERARSGTAGVPGGAGRPSRYEVARAAERRAGGR
ncbi:glycosyltransferase [Lentzea sp.]|uniref:glycosyltransferase n=1 Tax=Lentzea sp. TaxID=56099 RepID=UPI002ECFB4F1